MLIDIFPDADRRKTSALSELWEAAISGQTHSELSTAMFFPSGSVSAEGNISINMASVFHLPLNNYNKEKTQYP